MTGGLPALAFGGDRQTLNIVRKNFAMQQPELGRRLTALRKEKGLTQEDLVEKSHVSVRTIQRIEAGEVLPRMITVKILLEALGVSYESFLAEQVAKPVRKGSVTASHRITLLTAVLAGAVYLVAEVVLGLMDIARMSDAPDWGWMMNAMYIGLTVLMAVSFALFARGFVALSAIFENRLLAVAAYMLIAAVAGKGLLDVISLSVKMESFWFPYAIAAVLVGAIGIVYGVALLRLQDSMGELSRVAGLLEIVNGCLFITVVLFFIAYVILIPATVIEILVLYRGYEYVSRLESVQSEA